jgi:hypothetical protein
MFFNGPDRQLRVNKKKPGKKIKELAVIASTDEIFFAHSSSPCPFVGNMRFA